MLVLAVRLLAAGVPVAAEIDVAIPLDVFQAQSAKAVDVIVEGSVGVPGVQEAAAVRVDEGESRRKGGVMVDNVGKVCH